MDLEVHYRSHQIPPPVPVLDQVYQVHDAHSTAWRAISILSSQLRLSFPSGLFTSGLPTKSLHAPHLSLTHATCPARLILIYGEYYRASSSSLFSFLYSPFLVPLKPKCLPQRPTLEHSPPMFVPQSDRPSLTPIQSNRQHLQFCLSRFLYFWIANWKTKDSAPIDSKYSLASICS